MWLAWLAIFVLYVLVVISFVMALLGGASLPFGVIGGLVVLTLFVPSLWQLVRRGGQSEFDPTNPPEALLVFK